MRAAPHPTHPTQRNPLPHSLQEAKAKREALRARALAAEQRIRDRNPRVTLADIMEQVKEGPLRLLATWAQQGARVRVVTRHAGGVRGTATGVLRGFDRFMNLLLQDVAEVYTVVLRVQRLRPKGQQRQGQQGQQQEEAQQQGQQQQGTQQQESAQGQQGTGGAQWQAQQQGQQQEQKQEQQQGQQPGQRQARQQTRWCRKQEQRQRQLAHIFIKGDNVVCVSAVQEVESAAAGGAAAHGPGE